MRLTAPHSPGPLVRAALVLAAAFAASVAGSQNAPDQELGEVRERIEALKKSLRRDTDRRDKAQGALRDVELEQADVRKRLADLADERADSEDALAALGRERETVLRRLRSESESLVDQVRMAYVSGRQERVRLVLNQGDAASIGRVMSYYRYLTEARAEGLARVRGELDELERLRLAQEEESARIRQVQARERRALEKLEQVRAEREGVIARLAARLAEQDAEIAALNAREEELQRLIAELQRVFTDPPQPQEEFVNLKGELNWPVPGIILASYGEQRAGSRVRWNGVLLGAKRGAPVQAIAHGRVAFADWLPGMGMLIVLEHGGNYMSLYAHNETLTKNPGDWVAPGEVLATVGDSGGQPEPALYFEIRRGADPQNPRPWFRGRPPRP